MKGSLLKLLLLSVFSILFLSNIGINLTFAQTSYQTQNIPTWNIGGFQVDVQTWLSQTLGIPRDWAAWPTVFWLLILPYISTLAIIYGFLETIGIFRGGHTTTIYLIIAAGWAMFLIPTGFLGTIATVFYSFGAMLSVIAFSVLFIFGVIIYSVGRGRSIWGYGRGVGGEFRRTASDIENDIDHLRGKKNAILRNPNLDAAERRRQTARIDLQIAALETRLRDTTREAE